MHAPAPKVASPFALFLAIGGLYVAQSVIGGEACRAALATSGTAT